MRVMQIGLDKKEKINNKSEKQIFFKYAVMVALNYEEMNGI